MNSPFMAQVGGVFEGGCFGMSANRGIGFFGDFGQMPEVEASAYIKPPTGSDSASRYLSMVNAPMKVLAPIKIAEYDENIKYIPAIKDSVTRQGAYDIVNKAYYATNLLDKLGITKGGISLAQLAQKVKDVLAGGGNFVDYRVDANGNIKISRSNAKKLEAFYNGNRDLRNFMSKLVVLPTVTKDNVVIQQSEKVVLQQVGLDAQTLLNNAIAARDKARASKSPVDAAMALATAMQALAAAEAEGHEGYMAEAQSIIDEMGPLAKIAGGGGDTTPTNWLLYGGIAAAVVAILVGVYFVTKK